MLPPLYLQAGVRAFLTRKTSSAIRETAFSKLRKQWGISSFAHMRVVRADLYAYYDMNVVDRLLSLSHTSLLYISRTSSLIGFPRNLSSHVHACVHACTRECMCVCLCVCVFVYV